MSVFSDSSPDQSAGPELFGEFALIGIDEGISWRNALAKHLLQRMAATWPMPDWKLEEQVEHMNLTIRLLMAQGLRTVAALEQYFSDTPLSSRAEHHAPSQ